MSDDTLDRSRDSLRDAGPPEPQLWALTLAWTRHQPENVGEVAFVPAGSWWTLGRDTPGSDRLRWSRPGPQRVERGGALTSRYLSRAALRVRVLGPEALQIQRRSKTAVRINGTAVETAQLRAGDALEVDGELVCVATRRPRVLAGRRTGPFASPDPSGLVGESPALHAVRRRLDALRTSRPPVLITGPSGSGKELTARALHGDGPFVAVNVSALPPGVLSAELFGNVANYPNPGTPARRGLVGAAEGGTLFLDELGELPHALQAPLLRLLDHGEVQRLGADRVTRLDVRIVAATNRPPSALKHDVAARFTQRLVLPGLDARPDDIGLLAHHLLRGAQADLPPRFFADGQPRLAPDLVIALLRHRWTTHVRELDRLLRESAATSEGTRLTWPPGLQPRSKAPLPAATTEPTADQIREALAACDGVKERTWRALGLRNRHQLRRLMARHGLA